MSRKEKRRIKKLSEKVLDALSEKVPLSTNKGDYISKFHSFKSKRVFNSKVRRHWGMKTPKMHQKIPQGELINNALEPQPEYNDWWDFRDGFRKIWDEKWVAFHWKKKSRKIKKMLMRKKARLFKMKNNNIIVHDEQQGKGRKYKPILKRKTDFSRGPSVTSFPVFLLPLLSCLKVRIYNIHTVL